MTCMPTSRCLRPPMLHLTLLAALRPGVLHLRVVRPLRACPTSLVLHAARAPMIHSRHPPMIHCWSCGRTRAVLHSGMSGMVHLGSTRSTRGTSTRHLGVVHPGHSMCCVLSGSVRCRGGSRLRSGHLLRALRRPVCRAVPT